MKRRILFVDDESKVLRGLQRMLRAMRDEWDMAFAQSAEQALDALAVEHFDVLVTDMRMPGMDGAQLLTTVRRRHPEVVRVVLSGHSEQESILRSVGTTHQYLAKPCDPEQLKNVIARACALRDTLTDESLRQLVSQMNTLPSLPQTYVKIMETLRSPDASTKEVGQIIAGDVGMTAKILQIVNSAFFGLRRHVPDPVQAAALLGIDILKALVLSVHIFSQLDEATVEGFSLEALRTHSTVTATLAKRTAAAEDCDARSCDHAFMAGLLHDVGKLIIAANVPERYRDVLRLAREEGLASWVAEERLLATTHAEVGAYLLGIWGLPDPIIEAVAFHHHPDGAPVSTFNALAAVHIADCLQHEEDAASPAPDNERLNAEFLARMGLSARLPAWRELHLALVQEGVQQ
jgi:HD-like signal output (HDOD) protein